MDPQTVPVIPRLFKDQHPENLGGRFVTLCLKSPFSLELTPTKKGHTRNFVRLSLRHTTKELVY